MTVGDLKRELQGLDDDLKVCVAVAADDSGIDRYVYPSICRVLLDEFELE